MPLLDLKTDLKSLKYGADRPGGGDSGLPYIKTDINKVDQGFNRLRSTKFDDGLIRGGVIGALNASVTDTVRITKFLTDPPKGPLFIVKQVGLQLSNPRLEVPKNPFNIASGLPDSALSVGTNGLLQPTRIYNLGINTLAQIPVNAIGGHINRHGLLPTQTKANTYEAIATANNDINGSSKFNRLIQLTNKFELGNKTLNPVIDKRIAETVNTLFQIATGNSIIPININPKNLIIDDYIAGPNSVYGIGRTTINRYINTEDAFKVNLSKTLSRNYAGKTRSDKGDVEEIKIKNTYDYGISNITSSLFAINSFKDLPSQLDDNSSFIFPREKDRIVSHSISGSNKVDIVRNGPSSYPDREITGSSGFGKYNLPLPITVYDYGTSATKTYATLLQKQQQSSNFEISQSYYGGTFTTKTIQNKKSKRYSEFSRVNDRVLNEDTLKLIFSPINPFDGTSNTAKEFLGYLANYSENYDSGWSDIRYAGRAESFYVFNSFKKTVSLGFNIPCFNEEELINNHTKLLSVTRTGPNISANPSLAYALSGQYKDNLLGGVLIKLTVGNYLVNCPGIINSLNVEILQESPWDIDNKLAHYLKVTINFTVIGNELPAYETDITPTPTPPSPTPVNPDPIPNPNPRPGPLPIPTNIDPNIVETPKQTDSFIYANERKMNQATQDADRRFQQYYYGNRTFKGFGGGSGGGGGATGTF